MNFKVENLLVKKLDTYLVNRPYKDVFRLIHTLQLGIKAKTGEKNEEGQITIDFFVMDSKLMNHLFSYLLNRPEEEVGDIMLELRQCDVYEGDVTTDGIVFEKEEDEKEAKEEVEA